MFHDEKHLKNYQLSIQFRLTISVNFSAGKYLVTNHLKLLQNNNYLASSKSNIERTWINISEHQPSFKQKKENDEPK